MQARIDPLTGDYDGTQITHLGNAVYLRIKTPRGSYWPDPSFGSRLHLLNREKDLARLARQAEQYAREALQPLLDDGRATRLEVQAVRESGRLTLRVTVFDANGEPHRFEHPVEVV